jgi:hypothetical protein
MLPKSLAIASSGRSLALEMLADMPVAGSAVTLALSQS